MKKISVAVGADGRTTLGWSVDLARLTGVPLDVVNVFEPTYAEISPDWYEELVAARRSELARSIEGIDDVDIDVVVLSGHEPLREFARYLDDSTTDLGVVGALGTHGPGGFGWGRPGHTLVHHATQPIAVVHPEYAPLAGGVVVVGVDGSPANAPALAWADEVAAAAGGTLHAVFVDDPTDVPTSADRIAAWVDEQRAGATSAERAPLLFQRMSGHATSSLIDHAARVGAGLVVTGTRGQGGFDGLVLGRVPAQLLAQCTTPLVVVPH